MANHAELSPFDDSRGKISGAYGLVVELTRPAFDSRYAQVIRTLPHPVLHVAKCSLQRQIVVAITIGAHSWGPGLIPGMTG